MGNRPEGYWFRRCGRCPGVLIECSAVGLPRLVGFEAVGSEPGEGPVDLRRSHALKRYPSSTQS
jgi:hypothetical protein